MPSGSATMTTAPSSLRAAIERAANDQLLRKAVRAGVEGVQEVAREAASTYPRKRPESRRRGAAPLDDPGNYDYVAQAKPAGGVRLEFFVANRDPQFRVKFFSLNNGSRGHVITPNWPRRTLAYNRDNPASESPNYFPLVAPHPGTSGSKFFDKAVQRVMGRLRS
jgi:hypothetical protein